MTKSKPTSHSDWANCQGGEISGLVQRLKQQRTASRRTQIVRSLSIAAGLVVMVGIGWAMLPKGPLPGEAMHGGIACKDVLKNGEAFVLHELDQEMTDRIKLHLGECETCQQKINSLRENFGLNSFQFDRQSRENYTAVSTAIVALLPSQ